MREIELLRRLLTARSEPEILSLLVDEPHLDPQRLLDICRNAESYGFPTREAAYLRAQAEVYARLFLAVGGELLPDVSSWLYGTLGMMFRQRGNLSRARRFYLLARDSARTIPERVAALNSLGVISLQRKEEDEAERILAEARQLCEASQVFDFTYLNVLVNLGTLAMSRQGFDEARALFRETAERATRLGRTHEYIVAQLNLAELCRRTGAYAESLSLLAEVEPLLAGVASPREQSQFHMLREWVLGEQAAATHRGGAAERLDELEKLALRACRDSRAVAEIRELVAAPDFPFDELGDRVENLLRPVFHESPETAYQVARSLRDVAEASQGAVPLAQITYLLCARFTQPTIEERVRWLEGSLARLRSGESAVEAAAFAMLSERLALEHFADFTGDRPRHLRQAIHHWQATIEVLSGRRGSHDLPAVLAKQPGISAHIGEVHHRIGCALNELWHHEPGVKLAREAERTFRIALDLLPDVPEHAEARAECLVNLSNALSRGSGKNEAGALEAAVELQNRALDFYRPLPHACYKILINIVQCHLDLSRVDPPSAQVHLESAARLLADAEREFDKLPEKSPEQELQWALTGASLQLLLPHDETALQRWAGVLRGVLGRVQHDAPPHETALAFQLAASLWDRLGLRRRAYKWCLEGLRYLHALPLSAIPAASRRESWLEQQCDRFFDLLLGWGEVRRALSLANQTVAASWRPGRRRLQWGEHRRKPWLIHDPRTCVWLRYSKHRLVFLVAAGDSVEQVSRPLPFQDLFSVIEPWVSAYGRFREAMAGPGDSERALEGWKSATEKLCLEMGELFFAPLAPLLEPSRGLVLLPSGLFHNLPLHLAVLPSNGVPVHLVDRFDVEYAPYFEPPGARDGQRETVSSLSLLAFSPPQAPIPYTDLERALVCGVRRKGRLETKHRGAATAAAVLDALQTSLIVHLCCHGDYNFVQPLESSLHLSDRRLSVRELQMRLHGSPTSLIVLSACETGMREPDLGNAYVGFPGALLRAGASRVVGSLWSVDDLSTALLMGRFYHELSGEPSAPSRALCQAQRWLGGQTAAALVEMLREAISLERLSPDAEPLWSALSELEGLPPESRPFEHPVSWGAFYLVSRPTR